MDDDCTVMPPPRAAPERGDDLPSGTRFGDLEILDTVAAGGFGIVYRTRDHSLNRIVALKEYMPSSLAARDAGTRNVRIRSTNGAESFEIGLRSFVKEARFLAHFDHPAVVKVHMFFRANGTAYMVMPFYAGITLKARLAAMPGLPDEAWLKAFLTPVMDALTMMHSEQCFHRDISPDNILVLEGTEQPMLLDFGAARHVIKDTPQALTVILKPNYAPIEQYDDFPGMTQGAWTDVYALAATLYSAVTRRPPPPAHSRLINDTCIPAVQAGAGKFSESFLRALDNALAIKPDARTQSIQAMREEMGVASPVVRSVPQPGPASVTVAGPRPDVSGRKPALRPIAAAAVAAVLVVSLVLGWVMSRPGSPAQSASLGATPGAGGSQAQAPSAVANAATKEAAGKEMSTPAPNDAPNLASNVAPRLTPDPAPKVVLDPAPKVAPDVAPKVVLDVAPAADVDAGNAARGGVAPKARLQTGAQPGAATPAEAAVLPPTVAPDAGSATSPAAETPDAGSAARSVANTDPAIRGAEAAEARKKKSAAASAAVAPRPERQAATRSRESAQASEHCAELASRYQNGSLSYNAYAKDCAK